jgi:hypothetical protein
MAYNADTPTIYSRLRTLPTSTSLVCNTGTGLPGQINVYVGKQNGHHYLKVTSDANELSDVNGLKISYDDTGITFTSFDETHSKTINWS